MRIVAGSELIKRSGKNNMNHPWVAFYAITFASCMRNRWQNVSRRDEQWHFCSGVLEPLLDHPITVRLDHAVFYTSHLLHLCNTWPHMSDYAGTEATGYRLPRMYQAFLPHKKNRCRYAQYSPGQPPPRPQPRPKPRISWNCGVGLFGPSASHRICSDTLPSLMLCIITTRTTR